MRILKKPKSLILITMAGLLLLPSFLNIILLPQSAHAAQANPADQLERWLYYRGMRGCLEKPDWGITQGVAGTDDNDGDRTASDINKGHLLPGGYPYQNSKEGFGYLAADMDGADGNDGTVQCSDGSIWVRGATLFGFNNVVELVCAMNAGMTELGAGDKIEPSNGTNCEDSEKITFHHVEDSGSIFQQAFTWALSNRGDKDRPSFQFNDNEGPDYTYKSLLYLLGKKSLETFCGNGASIESASVDNDSYKNSDDVVSVFVVQSDGTIKESQSYPIANTDRNESSSVDDVYYAQGSSDNEADNRTCADMARFTREGAEDYLKWARNHSEEAASNSNSGTPDGSGSPSGDNTTTCAVDGIGWIVCPVLSFMGKMNEAAFGFISDFLTVEPKLLTDADTKAAWNNFRDIANVAFVIAFLIIVYSQIVGGGLSNYGIKKMLPRLVIAAVLVNVSYYLCQIAVDLSNIAGSSVYSFFKDIPTASQGTTGFGDGLSWEKVTGYALAAAGVIIVAIVALGSISAAALLAFVLMILILIARKAALLLLVVISPLAFVAYLLPNTEQWFKKWWKMFSTLLMVFPVVGVIFGASTLAARIVNNSAGDPNDSNLILQITALGIMAVPLFAVPLVLKSAMSATGSVGAKLAGLQGKATGAAGKGARERLKRRGENIEARMAGSDKRFARLAGGYRNRRAFSHKSLETDTARRQQQALTEEILRNPGNYTPRQLAEAKSASLKEYNEEVGREKSTMSDLDHGDLMNIVKDKNASEERRAAAAGVIGSRSFRKGHQELLDYIGDDSHVSIGADGKPKMDDAIKTVQQQTAYDMKDQPLGMGDADKSALGEGRFTKPRGVNAAGIQRTVSQEGMLQRLHEGKVSEQAFANMNPDDLALVQQLKSGGHLTDEAQATIDGLIERLSKPEMAAVYAASKDNARKIHATLHS